MALTKPQHIADDPIMSAKWDEITEAKDYAEKYATTIEELCFWYSVRRKCQDDITYDGGIQVAYQNNMGDVKAMPQLTTAKQASDQIRQLNKQLGINDEISEGANEKHEPVILKFANKRTERRARAAN